MIFCALFQALLGIKEREIKKEEFFKYKRELKKHLKIEKQSSTWKLIKGNAQLFFFSFQWTQSNEPFPAAFGKIKEKLVDRLAGNSNDIVYAARI